MGWIKVVENDPSEKTATWGKDVRQQPGDVTSIVACKGKVITYDDDDDIVAVFAGADDGFIAMYNNGLCFEKDWRAHRKEYGVNCIAVGKDSRDETYVYSCSAFGELKQWWPAALELIYRNCAETPGSESKGFTSAGGSIDSAVKQLLWRDEMLYSGDDVGQLCKWDAGLNLQWYKNTYSDIASLALGGEGDNLLVFTANPIQSQVVIGDLKPRKNADNSLDISNMLAGKSPLAVDSSAEILLCGDMMDNSIQLYNRKSAHGWELKHRLEGHEDTVSCVAISPDKTFAATGGWDGNVIVWKIAGGEQQAKIKCGDFVNCVCWGPDGEIYAGGKGGSVVKIMRTD